MLRYIGDGFIVGIPARDLTEDEVKELGGEKFLIATGLYQKIGRMPSAPTKKEEEHPSKTADAQRRELNGRN